MTRVSMALSINYWLIPLLRKNLTFAPIEMLKEGKKGTGHFRGTG